MKALDGVKVEGASIRGSKKVADLIWLDGPLLSLHRDTRGVNYLFYWCDSSPHANRWLITSPSEHDLSYYLRGQCSLRDLIIDGTSEFVHVADIGHGLSYTLLMIVGVHALPPDYLPEADSFYSIAELLHPENVYTRALRIAINGKWSFHDINTFPRYIRQAYAYVYQSTERNFAEWLFKQLPMRDGMSTTTLLNSALLSIPMEDRPGLRAVHYASPGVIVFDGREDVANKLVNVIQLYQCQFDKILSKRNEILQMLQSRNLRGKDVTTARLPPHENEELFIIAAEFGSLFKPVDSEAVISHSLNGLMAVKVVLAFERLLGRIHKYLSDERAIISAV